MGKTTGMVMLLAGLSLTRCKKKHEAIPPPRVNAVLDKPPAPPTLSLSVQYQLPDAGWDTLQPSAGPRPTALPTAALKVTSNLRLQNVRVRLLDEAERVMVSDDEIEHPESALDYRLVFPSRLQPGHHYAIVVDAQNGPTFLDSEGHSHPDQRIEFQVSGEREKPMAPTKKRHKRRGG
jgi:hypothetical protein